MLNIMANESSNKSDISIPSPSTKTYNLLYNEVNIEESERYMLPDNSFFDPAPIITFDVDKIKAMKQEIRRVLEFDESDIPSDIKIATMTLEGRFKTMFYPWNIYKYMKYHKNGITKVVKVPKKQHKKTSNDDDILLNDIPTEENIYKDPAEKSDDIGIYYDDKNISTEEKNEPTNKKENQTKNRQSDMFLNQVTVSINVSNKENPVSVKIFSNGTVHFTGCVSLDNMFEATYKLCVECSRDVWVFNKGRKIKRVRFVKDPSVLRVENLTGIKADMINCIFVAPFKIDRPKLQILMKTDGYKATYDSNGHAGVKIKYVSTGKKITIFVFEAGSIIIILGKQGFKRISEIYNFIYKYILENYESIVKIDEITTSVILRYVQREKQKMCPNLIHNTDLEDDTAIEDLTYSTVIDDLNNIMPSQDTVDGTGKLDSRNKYNYRSIGRPISKPDYSGLIDVSYLERSIIAKTKTSPNIAIKLIRQT